MGLLNRRYIRHLLAVAFITAALAGCGSAGDVPATSEVDSGFGSQDATADVKLGVCHDGGKYARDVVKCPLVITNHSNKTSDYYIEGQALRGTTIIGGFIVGSVQSVPPGGSAEIKLGGLVDGKWDSVQLITVQRTSS